MNELDEDSMRAISADTEFNRKIIPDNNHKTGFISKKRFYEDEINFEELRSYRLNRVKKDKIDEVIIATSATVEGQTTAYYIKDSLKDTKVKVSKLAQGLPVGGEIESLDDGTLFSAFKNRRLIDNNSD